MSILRTKTHNNFTVVCPVVNNNGSNAVELVENLRNAYRAIGDAIDALRECAPHGRDYQHCEPTAFTQARAQHQMRVAQLAKVQKELELIAIDIQDQTG